MFMATIKVRFDGRVFVPEQPVDLPAGTSVEIPIPAAQPAARSGTNAMERVAEMHPRAIETTTDFDAPLPDDFWLGKP
jgi:hypothetical protein